eukprot:symbB.v1.2.018412.t1/scaffold1463.1/size117174/3
MQLSLAALLEAGSEGTDSFDLTRLHQLLTEMPKETGGANHMLLQLLEAIFSKLQVPWPAAQPKAGSIDDHSPSWLIAAEASRRTHAWLWLLLKDPGLVVKVLASCQWKEGARAPCQTGAATSCHGIG